MTSLHNSYLTGRIATLLLQQKIRINYIIILSFTNLLYSHKHYTFIAKLFFISFHVLSLPDHSCHHRHLQGSVLHGWFPTTVLPCSLVPAYPHAWWPPDEQWGTLYMFYWAAQGVSCSFSYLLHCGCWLWGRWTPLYHFTSIAPPYSLFFHQGLSNTELYQYILYITSSSTLSDSILLF